MHEYGTESNVSDRMLDVKSALSPIISVVMPCFNAEKHLEKSIGSVLQQSFHDFELIIVNDGSTDNSQEIVERSDDSRIRIINQNNSGVCSARNAALLECTGEFIAFLRLCSGYTTTTK